jgi:hypothetical protein
MKATYHFSAATGALQNYMFVLNELLVIRCFKVRIEGERLIVHAADDKNFCILDALANEVSVNGVVYDNPTEAQAVLMPLIFSTEDLVLLSSQLQTLIQGAVQKIEGKGLSSNDFTDEFKAKLEGLQQVDISNKVDKEEGKGLSSNNFTDEDKDKLRLALKNGFKEIRCYTTDSGDFNIVIKVNKGRVTMTYNLATNHNVALKKYADEQFRLLEEQIKAKKR